MNDTSSDDILLLKQRLAEQEALIHALQEKLSCHERCNSDPHPTPEIRSRG